MTGLRQRLIQIVLASGVAIALAVVVATTAFYFAQNKLNSNQTYEQMERVLESQVAALTASYLIPEQSAGRDMLLEKYRESEGLESLTIIPNGVPLPNGFSSCRVSNEKTRCESDDGSIVALLVPLRESENLFGHIFKTKRLQSVWWVFRYAIVAFAVLLLLVGLIVILISRMYAKVASSIRNLETWTGMIVRGTEREVSPQVHFKEFETLGQNIKLIIDEGTLLRKEALTTEIAKQVAHDIRAPLTALSVTIDCMKDQDIFPEQKSAIINATKRIKDIADSLINKKPKTQNIQPSNAKLTTVAKHIEVLLEEKRAQYADRKDIALKFVNENPDAVASVSSVEFLRVLSNLINNSVEAMPDGGVISLSLLKKDAKILLELSDTGRGIPKEILEKLGTKGLTYGRPEGSGLGVYHAIKTIREAGGTVEYLSSNSGTTVKIILPEANKEEFFVVPLSALSKIIIIDDDSMIHHAWAKGWKIEEVEKQLSWNLYLNQPVGGDLKVYSRFYELKDEAKRVKGEYYYDYSLVKDAQVFSYTPRVGEIVVFNSRNFHEVLPVSGDRFSLSSFIGKFPNGDLGLWS